MTKIEVFKKTLNKGVTKIKVVKKKVSWCDKNQGYREKLNKGMTKTKVDKKKFKQRSRLLRKIKDKCDKN